MPAQIEKKKKKKKTKHAGGRERERERETDYVEEEEEEEGESRRQFIDSTHAALAMNIPAASARAAEPSGMACRFICCDASAVADASCIIGWLERKARLAVSASTIAIG